MTTPPDSSEPKDKVIELDGLDLLPHKTITLYLNAPNKQTLNLWEETDEFLLDDLPASSAPSLKEPTPETDEIEIGEKLGEGGMGVVYLGKQKLPERDVAVKRLKSNNPAMAKALLHEAMMTGALEHPNIIPIHSVNLDEKATPEVVMKRVIGKSLAEEIDGSSPNEEKLRQLLHLLIQVCRPLEFSHSKSIIHRDIKPENIMMGAFGEVYLLDWGLAIDLNKVNKAARGLVGTPSYMAPEMVYGDPYRVTHLTDIYLLGATLHEFLVGKRRHEAKTITKALQQAKESVPYSYPQNILTELADLANKACSPKPEDRPQSVEEFRTELENILQYWEALRISQAAMTKLNQLEDIVLQNKTNSEENIKAHQLFSQARFGFEQALNIYPKCAPAKNGIQQNLELMITLMIASDQLKYAESLMGSLYNNKQKFKTLIKEKLQQQLEAQQESQRLKEFAANYDRASSITDRKNLAKYLFFVSIMLISTVVVYDNVLKSGAKELTNTRLVTTTGIVALTTMILIFMQRKRLFATEIGKRLATALGGGATGLVLVALIGIITKTSPNTVMMADLIVVAITFINAYPVIRHGYTIGFLCLILIMISLVEPSFAHTGLLLSCVIATLGTMMDFHRETNDN